MDVGRRRHFDRVESSALDDIDVYCAKSFARSEKESDLRITRCLPNVEGNGGRSAPLLESRRVFGSAELHHFAAKSDLCQIYYIRQKNSYARLNITKELFQEILSAYAIFPQIWDFVLPFSFKTRESDIGHAPFIFRQARKLATEAVNSRSFECAYGYRYVVLNHRKEATLGNPDYDPWSIRQCAVYQQYNSENNRLAFILISPSELAGRKVEESISKSLSQQKSMNAFNLHRILVSTLYENWRLYIRSLERLLKDQSDKVTLAQVRSETERLSPLMDLRLNFVDRQRLKIIEDKILDLLIIFESLNHTLSQLREQCRIHCLKDLCLDCQCSVIIEELGEKIHEGTLNMKRVDILYKRTQGIANLLSDLLDHENAQIAHRNGESLFRLAAQTADENNKMRILTERSTRDAAAVRILTVITLIYLPVTVVASIFSSQLIHVDDYGRVSVVSESWWFAVVTVPLTVVTFLIWQYWLSSTMKKQEPRKQTKSGEKASDRHCWFHPKRGGLQGGNEKDNDLGVV